MIKALFYKEWIKTRAIVSLIAIIYVVLLIYTLINTQQIFRVNGAVDAWVAVLSKNTRILRNEMYYLPIFVGLLLALAQFVPEIMLKRLKLTLHLPLREWKIILATLLYGVLMLVATYGFCWATLIAIMHFFYPIEIIVQVNEASALWFYSATLTYLFAAWICVEPSWKQRVFNAIIAVCVLSLFFISNQPGVYVKLIPYLLFLLFVCFILPFYAVARFKEGVQ